MRVGYGEQLRVAVLCAVLIAVGGWIDRRLFLPLAAVVAAGYVAAAIVRLRRRARRSPRTSFAFLAMPLATVGPGATRRAMRQLMRSFPSQPVIPVIDGGSMLCGVVVCSELLRDPLDDRSARELMRDPVSADVGTPAGDLAALMRRENLPAVPVLERGVLVGLMCRSTAIPASSADPVFLRSPASS